MPACELTDRTSRTTCHPPLIYLEPYTPVKLFWRLLLKVNYDKDMRELGDKRSGVEGRGALGEHKYNNVIPNVRLSEQLRTGGIGGRGRVSTDWYCLQTDGSEGGRAGGCRYKWSASTW